MSRFEKRLKAVEIDISLQSDDHVTEIRIRIIDPQIKEVCGLHQIQVGYPGQERYFTAPDIPPELLPEQGVRYETI